MIAFLLGLTLVGMGTPLPTPPPPEPPDHIDCWYQENWSADPECTIFDLPPVTPKVEARPTEAPELTGRASWYEYVPGGAAAGPKLRAWLGKGWRGTKVNVCTDVCRTVTLSDWCQCYKGEKRERIIDLDVRTFDALGDPGDGVMKVTIEQSRTAYRMGAPVLAIRGWPVLAGAHPHRSVGSHASVRA